MAHSLDKYPLDLTGAAVTNKVVSEPATIPEKGRIIIPDHAPYFASTMEVFHVSENRMLVPNIDYKNIHMVAEATVETSQEIVLGYTIINPGLTDGVVMDYQVIGGDYSVSHETLVNAVENLQLQNKTVEWHDVVGKPRSNLATRHLFNAQDLVGLHDLVERIEDVKLALLEGRSATRTAIEARLTKLEADVADLYDKVSRLA